MFAANFGQQFYRQGSQYHTGGKVLDQAACAVARCPKGGQDTAAQSDQGRDAHDHELM